MNIIIYILILVGTFIAMEGVTWLTHRYIMHGLLWYLHKDHHQIQASSRCRVRVCHPALSAVKL